MDPDTRRARWRADYAQKFPEGFKRRRNAEQRAKQRAAQKKYNTRPAVRYSRMVREYLAGKGPKQARDIVGCSPQDLRRHLDASLQGAPVLKWALAYVRHPRHFNLEVDSDVAICFHYRNMYARPIRLKPDSSLSPCQPAPSPADSSRAEPSEMA